MGCLHCYESKLELVPFPLSRKVHLLSFLVIIEKDRPDNANLYHWLGVVKNKVYRRLFHSSESIQFIPSKTSIIL